MIESHLNINRDLEKTIMFDCMRDSFSLYGCFNDRYHVWKLIKVFNLDYLLVVTSRSPLPYKPVISTLISKAKRLCSLFVAKAVVSRWPESTQKDRDDKTPSLLDYGASICTFKPSFKPFKA